MSINIEALLREGAAFIEETGQGQEELKIGTLRGGNSGVLYTTEEGETVSVGSCARVAMLRSLGIKIVEDQDDFSKGLMFGAGRANEDEWVKVLEASWLRVPGNGLLRETDVPTSWETRTGKRVTGRPDIVLTQDGTAKLGLELKQVCSLWTAIDVLADKPKAPHLAQAAHYSMALGVPFELWYTNRSNYYSPADQLFWLSSKLPRHGARNYEYVDYKQKVSKKDGLTYWNAFRVIPFVKGFRLEWREQEKDGMPDKVVWVKPIDLDDSHFRQTVISENSLKAYYEAAATAPETDILPPGPQDHDAFGESKFALCDYCPLKDTCKSFKGGAREFIKLAQRQETVALANKENS